MFHGKPGRLFDFFDRINVQAMTAWQVCIRLQQPATVRAERAIEDFFPNSSDGQKVVGVTDHSVVGQTIFHVDHQLFEGHV